jgi:hypothetical protein
LIDNCICDNNRRQGCSICSAYNVKIINSIFSNTNGTLPQSGIDVEPNSQQICEKLSFINNKFINNSGCGLVTTCGQDANRITKEVLVSNNFFENNGGYGYKCQNTSKAIIKNNEFNSNYYDLGVRSGSYDVLIDSNHFYTIYIIVVNSIKISNNIIKDSILVSYGSEDILINNNIIGTYEEVEISEIIDDMKNSGIYLSCDQDTGDPLTFPKHINIIGNRIYNKSYGITGYNPGDYLYIKENIIMNSYYGIVFKKHSSVSNEDNYCSNHYFENNIIYSLKENIYKTYIYNSNFTIKNNICVIYDG